MSEGDERQLRPMATLAAFARAAYSDLLTVVILSLAFTLVSLPVVTVGAALLALCDVFTDAITRGATDSSTETDRVGQFLHSVRAYLRNGLVFSAVLIGVVGATGIYLIMGLSSRQPAFLLGALVGLYAIVITTVWVFRAASVFVRAPSDRAPTPLAALRIASHLLIEPPSFTVLHFVFAAALFALTGALPIAAPLLLPGLLAVLEVTVFEETNGDGALSVVRGYRGEPA